MNLSQYINAHYQDELDDAIGDLTWSEFCEMLELDETDEPSDPLDWLDSHDDAWRHRLEIALSQKVLGLLTEQYREEGPDS